MSRGMCKAGRHARSLRAENLAKRVTELLETAGTPADLQAEIDARVAAGRITRVPSGARTRKPAYHRHRPSFIAARVTGNV